MLNLTTFIIQLKIMFGELDPKQKAKKKLF